MTLQHQALPFTGSWLHSCSSSYQVQSFLGRGTYGQVMKCIKTANKKTVAIKMIKNNGLYAKIAQREIEVLKKIQILDPDKSNIVQWYDHFIDQQHICLEFEHLGKSLLDLMKESLNDPLPLREIRPIVQQIANALDNLKSAGIVHADLKLENTMLVNPKEPYRVKVIDFGLAFEVSAAKVGSNIQSLPYRSPEILLGAPFTEAIDVWSLGITAAALYLNEYLYCGKNEYDMLRYITDTQGQLPEHMLASGTKTARFFQRFYHTYSSSWILKLPGQFRAETGTEPRETRSVRLSSLDDLLRFHKVPDDDKAAAAADVCMFVDMMKGLLELDPSRRMTPREVIEHPFISMKHLRKLPPSSPYAQSCFRIMDISQRRTAESV